MASWFIRMGKNVTTIKSCKNSTLHLQPKQILPSLFQFSPYKTQTQNNNNKDNDNQEQGQGPWYSYSTGSSGNNDGMINLSPDEFFTKFTQDVLDSEHFGFVMDGLLRNTVRMTVELHAPRFGSLPLLRGKNLVYLHLVALDEDRAIQGKLYMTGSQVDPNSPDLIRSSRKLFKEAVPLLLKDTDHWFFSRSLVFEEYNGVFDEAVKFSEYDPVGGLLEPPPAKLPDSVRCAEAFVLVAGDFAVQEGGLSSREAVKELLLGLNTEEGMTKLLAFDCVAASVVVTREKLEELKNMAHMTSVV